MKVKEKPQLVDVIISSGDSLSVGLGIPGVTLLSYIPSSGKPPYYLSKSRNEESHNTVVYYYNNTWSEFPSFSIISMKDAIPIIRDFVENGTLSHKIEWVEG